MATVVLAPFAETILFYDHGHRFVFALGHFLYPVFQDVLDSM